MLNWLGSEVETAESLSGILVLANPWHNVIRPRGVPWPPPDLIQKLYQSRHVRAFLGSEKGIATKALGFYSDLQSLHSEDAITWSVFGPVAYAAPDIRANFVGALLKLIGVPGESSSIANVWLWRRLPHPDTLVPGGPEVDFGIQTDKVFLIGEAKWRSSVAVAQGVKRDKDQITLRREFCEKYGRLILPTCRRFVVLGVSLEGGIISPADAEAEGVALQTCDTTWKSVVSLDEHPLADEVRAYLSWKEAHTRFA